MGHSCRAGVHNYIDMMFAPVWWYEWTGARVCVCPTNAVVYRMNGSHADIPSSSSVPVSPAVRTPKYGPNRGLPTIRDLDTEQGSLGSQGSVDLPVDSGQARLLELGKPPQLRCVITLEAGHVPLHCCTSRC